VIFAINSSQPRPALCSIDFSLCSAYKSDKLNAGTFNSYFPDVYSLFSYSSALFRSVQNHISFLFMRFPTLSSKHPGVGYPAGDSALRFFDVSLCAAGNTSFSVRHRPSQARQRFDGFGRLALYLFKHLRAPSASTSHNGNGVKIAVVSHAAACAVASQPKSHKCRKLVAFRGYHAK
jgi:hypothetical protein